MTVAPEFPRPLPWAAVGQDGRRQTLEATSEECAALAARFGIPAVESLRAELELQPESDNIIRARGHLSARVVQSCVVTLEPVPQNVEEEVDLRFLAEGQEPSDDPEGPDEIPTERDILELGEALAEQLSLALDPYPRAPGAALPEEVTATEEEPARRNPFSVLKGGKA